MRILISVTLLCAIATIARGTLSHPDTGDECLNEIVAMNRRLDAVIAHSEGLEQLLTEVNRKLDGLIGQNTGHVTESPEQEPTTASAGPQPTQASSDLLTLVSVERSPTPLGSNFTVRLGENAGDMQFLVINTRGHFRFQVPELIEEEDGGMIAVSFSCVNLSATSSPSPSLIINDADSQQSAYIHLGNKGSHHEFERVNLQLPSIHVSPSDEVVYTPGQNANFTLTASVGDDSGIDGYFFGLNLDSMEYNTYYNRDELFTWESVDTPQGKGVAASLLSSTNPVTGYLRLVVSSSDIGGTLIRHIQTERTVIVRPSNQTGPYPTGYLHFVGSLDFIVATHTPILCLIGDQCKLDCIVVGNVVSRIKVDELTPTNGTLEVPSAKLTLDSTETYKSLAWTFTATEDSEITAFRCTAYDDINGVSETTTIEVQAATEGSIDQARSSIVIQDDPANPGMKEVTLNCAVTGRPLPTVAFLWATSLDNPILYFEAPDHVTTTGPDEGVATKVVTLQVETLAHMQNSNYKPTCEYYSRFGGNFSSHSFELPDPALSTQ